MVGFDLPDAPARGLFQTRRGGLLVAPGNRPVQPPNDVGPLPTPASTPTPARSGRERLIVAPPISSTPPLLERLERLQGPALESLVKRLVVQEARRAVVILSRWPGEGRTTLIRLLERARRRIAPHLDSCIIESTAMADSSLPDPIADERTVRWIDAGPQPDQPGAATFARCLDLLNPGDAALIVQRVGFTKERSLNELVEWVHTRDLTLVGIVRTFQPSTEPASNQSSDPHP